MRVALLTREFPPFIYGGAGVHVDFLSRELRALCDVDVHCIGAPRPGATAHADDDPRFAQDAVLRTFSADLSMVGAVVGADIVHSHTWYTNVAGHLTKLRNGIPPVVTSHSLEPDRPWKAEQLGGGYQLSLWAERTPYESAAAVIAVSNALRGYVLRAYPVVDPDRVHVVHNGIDATFFHRVEETDVLERIGVDPARPYLAFVGRITRQKGVPHLLRAALHVDPGVQLVLLAGAPDTPELEAETAVVASDVGGIPEVVVDGETGVLVHYDESDPEAFERGLAAAVNEVVADPARAAAMGKAGRERAVREFGWNAVAARTLQIYDAAITAAS
jgi:starch synthase